MSQLTHPDVPNAVLPSGWLYTLRVQRLSDAAFRWAILLLQWSVANLTDGVLDRDDLDLVRFSRDKQPLTDELLRNGLLVDQRDGTYLLCGFGEQPTRASYETAQRRRAAQIDMEARRRTGRNREVFDRDGRRCVQCGDTENLAVDHIFPRRYGGCSELVNLQALCRSCNSRKGGRVPPGVKCCGVRPARCAELSAARQARTGELPPPATNGLGQCRTCDHREPLGPDGRCRSCVEWDVQEEVR